MSLNDELRDCRASLDSETRRANALSAELWTIKTQRRDYIKALTDLLEREPSDYNLALTSALSLFHETFRPRPSSMVGFLDAVYVNEGAS